MPDRNGVPRLTRIAVVVGGYLVAVLAASIVTWVHVRATSGPEFSAYSGMLAFGDSALFLGVFCLAAIPATGAALYFLRPVPRFWQVAAAIALGLSLTAVLALGLYLLPMGESGPRGNSWAALAPLRLLLAPVLACAWLLAVLFAPEPKPRRTLVIAAVTEAAAFTLAALALLLRP